MWKWYRNTKNVGTNSKIFQNFPKNSQQLTPVGGGGTAALLGGGGGIGAPIFAEIGSGGRIAGGGGTELELPLLPGGDDTILARISIRRINCSSNHHQRKSSPMRQNAVSLQMTSVDSLRAVMERH